MYSKKTKPNHSKFHCIVVKVFCEVSLLLDHYNIQSQNIVFISNITQTKCEQMLCNDFNFFKKADVLKDDLFGEYFLHCSLQMSDSQKNYCKTNTWLN